MELKADQLELSTIASAMQKHAAGEPPSGSAATFYADPAREQRLNLLLHLVHYAELLVVSSPSGSGKTTLLAEFRQRLGKDWQVHILPGAALAQETSMSNRLADVFGCAGDGHEDRMRHLIAHIPRLRRLVKPPVVVIDDAGKLSAASLQLIEGLLAAGDNYGKPLRVILAGDSGLDKLLADPQLAGLQGRIAHRLDVPPMSETHAAEFIKRYVESSAADKLDVFSAAVVKRIHRHSEGYPGRILGEVRQLLALQNTASLGEAPAKLMLPEILEARRSIGGISRLSPRSLIIGAIALGVVLVAIGLWRLLGSGGTQPALPEEIAPAPPATPTVVAEAAPAEVVTQPQDDTTAVKAIGVADQAEVADVAPAPPAAAESPSAPTVAIIDAESDTVTLPEASAPAPTATNVTDTTTTPTVADAAPAGSVNADDATPTAKSQETVAAQPSPAPVAEPRPETPAEEPVSAPKAEPAPAAPPRAAASPPSAGVGIKREAWLLAQNPNHFTLQLLAVDNEAAVVKFIKENDLGNSVAYFFSRRDGSPWYAVTYGSYPSRAAANAVALPPSLRTVKPWVRSFAGVQSAIRASAPTTAP